MFRRILLALVILGVVVAGAVGFAYLKPTAGASEPIAAVPLATVGPAATAETAELTGATEATAEQEAAVTEAAVTEAAGTEPQTEPQAASAASTPASTPIVFEIIPAESQARFIINEVLNGAPTTVVGATDQVAGQIAIDPSAPLNTQVGVIQINARTLATDNAMRNRAIANRILATDQYEYITFTPTAVAGLPETVAVGEAIQFQVTGDLTVRDVTQPVTFTAEATPVSDTRLEGAARATIRYADFGLAIPQVPSVASVDEEVVLEIEFAAEPV